MASRNQDKLDRLINDLKGKDTKEMRKRFRYQSKELTDHIDWTAYNEAQIEELDNQIVLIKNMVDDAARRVWKLINPNGREGRPPKSAADKAKTILVQQYFMATDRFAAKLAWFLREKLGLSEKLTPKDIERAYDDSDVAAILMEVFRMTNEPVREREFSIDGSGMPTSIKQNYANDRNSRKAFYNMLIGMSGINTKLFTAVTLIPPGSECPYLVPLLEETKSMHERIDMVCADAMYLSRENCAAIERAGGVPYIYPRKGSVVKAKGSLAWKRMLLSLIENPQEWLREYHKRSISESVNSVWKRKFLRPLSRRGEERRKMEAFSRAVCYNIRRLGYLYYLDGVDVPWIRAG